MRREARDEVRMRLRYLCHVLACGLGLAGMHLKCGWCVVWIGL